MVGKVQAFRRIEKKTILVGVHCSDSMVDALDRFIADQYSPMPRPEAIRLILIDVLGKSDYLKRTPSVDQDG